MAHGIRTTVACAVLALALGGCGEKTPTGQVVATVDGVEVTLQDVNAELAGAQLPSGTDRKEAQRVALQRVIDRKLFAAEAAKRELDKTPEFISQREKLDETLLAQQLVKQQAATLAQPSPADLATFKAENPNVFGNRQRLVVDQIRFQTPADTSSLKSLETVHTQDGVAAALRQKGILFERSQSAIDTASLPAEVVQKIGTLPPGEPFVLPARGIVTINVVTGKVAVPIPEDQANQIASNGWREKRFGTLVGDRLAQLKKAAKIDYQPGFGPAAAAGAKPGAAAAPAAGRP